MQLWLIHNAEQMILDDWEMNPEKYKGKRLSELTDDDDFDEENSVEYTKAYYKKTLLPKVIMVSYLFVMLQWVFIGVLIWFLYYFLTETRS